MLKKCSPVPIRKLDLGCSVGLFLLSSCPFLSAIIVSGPKDDGKAVLVHVGVCRNRVWRNQTNRRSVCLVSSQSSILSHENTWEDS